jgi:hypothetical protein
MRLGTRALAVFAILVIAATMAVAQTSSGSVSGTVTDPTGGVISAAKIHAVQTETGASFDTVTTDSGIYAFPALPVGPYQLTLDQAGFKQLVRSNIEVRLGERITLDLQLEVGSAMESIVVRATTPLLETTSAERGTNLLPTFMDKLPLYSGGIRNAETFISYMPGVNTGAGLSEVSIAGSGGRAKEVTIDGGSIVSPESGGMSTSNPGAEAFTEFKLTTAIYSAELGRVGGGVEAFNTKSGTNDIHGAGFWDLRRDIFNAAGWASNSVVGRTPGYRAKERYNEAGGSIGGPVYVPHLYNGRNKTFFFFTYTRDLRPESFSFTNSTVATLLQKQGNFSELAAPIYDPNTTSTVGGVSVRTAFAGSIIPKSLWSKVSSNILPLIPDPNGSGLSSNYTYANTSKFSNNIWTLKLDHSFRTTDRLSFFLQRYSDATAASTTLPGPLGTGITSYNRPDQVRVNQDLMLTPAMLLHTTASYSSTRSAWNNPLQQGTGSKIGLPMSGDSDATPVIGFTGVQTYSSWGEQSGKVNNGGQWNYTYQLTQALSWMRGKHEIKIGWDLRRLYTSSNDLATSNGVYSFASYQTADPSKLSSTGNAFASFLLGDPTSASQLALPVINTKIRYGYYSGYIEDHWRLTDRLTLDVGFRYEVPKGWHLKDGNYANFDPTLTNPGAGGLKGALIFAGNGAGRSGNLYLYPTDWSDVGPRLGFAYKLGSKTVLRGGWGIFYQAIGNGGCSGGGACNPGFAYTRSIASDGINPAFQWDAGIPYPSNYKAPPVIDPSYSNGQNMYYMPDNYAHAPRVQNWSVNVQQELKGFLIEVGYVGNRGTGLNSLREGNQLPTSDLSLGSMLTKNILDPAVVAAGYKEPFTGFATLFGKSATLAQALRPYPQYQSVYTLNSGDGKSWYDSLQTKVERRFGSLSLMGAYTFSKSLSTMHYREIFGSTTYGAQDAYNVSDMKSYLPFDQTHVLNILTAYDLPVGKGKKYLNGYGKIVNAAISGWSVAGTQKYYSGALIRLSSPTNTLNTEIFSQLTKANLTGLPVSTGVSRADLDPNNPNIRWFNYGANSPFTAPAQFALGTAAVYQSAFRNPPTFNENFSLMKQFALVEKVQLKFRADAYNVFNRTNFAAINGTVGNANFGRPTAATNGPRVITFGFRLDF